MKKTTKVFTMILIVILTFGGNICFGKYVLNSSFNMKINRDIDKTAPIITIADINNSRINNGGTAVEYATISYSDNIGIASAIYKYNATQNSFDNIASTPLEKNRKFTNVGYYYIQVKDLAGNTTTLYFHIVTAVAKIDNIYYTKLAYAIDDVPNNNSNVKTIVMLKNVTENNTMSNNKKIILDINKTTITGCLTIENGSSLTCQNGTITNNSSNSTFINNGTLRINSGTYTSSNSTVIETSGILNVGGGTIQSTGPGRAIYSAGTTTISGATVSSIGSGYAIYIASGTTNISSGIVTTSTSPRTIYMWGQTGGTLNITGGTISNTGKGFILYNSLGTANLSGGTYIGNNYSTYIYNHDELNVNGVTIASSNTYAISNEGTLTINSGTISTATGRAIHSFGTCNIKGGTVKSTSSGYALYISEGTTTMSAGSISCANSGYAIWNVEGKFRKTGGIVTGKTYGI